MQETRQQILEILKMRDQATVDDLSRELGLTTVTIRHHLEVLRSKGLIAPPKALRKGGPGRPQHIYRLADGADDYFPKSYDRLAEALLAELEDRLAPDERASWVEGIAQRIAGQAHLPEGDFLARLDGTLGFLNSMGYLAMLDVEGGGKYGIRISNCPYDRVARHHPTTCEIGVQMIARLVGVDPQSVQCANEELGRCVYYFSDPGLVD
ncbi:MAG: ArsR family transcriptional regulator [Anaerolineae bacterium]|nr:ArsR family transcriptional regulator [Anaerolineae bacterium]